jgi:tetratricopeptide (TPR) repeat protein
LAAINREQIEASRDLTEDEPLPPLDELLQELEELKTRSPDSPNLSTLCSKIGRVYEHRIETGESKDLEADRSATIDYFEKAIEGMRAIKNDEGEADNLISLGSFLSSQSRFKDAIEVFHQSIEVSQANNLKLSIARAYQGLGNVGRCLRNPQTMINYHIQALTLFQELEDRRNIAIELHNIGVSYYELNDYQKSIDYHSQSMEMRKAIGDRKGEAIEICALGSNYCAIGQYQKAVAFLEQALPTLKEFKNRLFEQSTLLNLGVANTALGLPQKGLEFYQQALEISQAIGNREWEAGCLFCMADAIAKLDGPFEALVTYQKAQAIFEEIPLEREVENCKNAIRSLNKIIPVQSTPFPDIPKRKKKSMSREDRIYLGFVMGVAIVLLVWLLRQ